MIDKALDAIKRFSLINSGDVVTVAVSGGADSVALLHLLYSLREELNITVKAAHLNHLIRGEEADRDEAFVKKLCEMLNIELFCERINVPKIAKENKQSLELAARCTRYGFFEGICEGKIATAHTANDNAETMLLNLSRGSGLRGLCGIPPKRDIYIRPLILCSRCDIEKYCADNGLTFVTDSTNLSDDYTRNKIRHNALPTLCEINSNVISVLSRTAEMLWEDNTALDYAADELLFKAESDDGLLADVLKSAPVSIMKRAIIKYAKSIDNSLELDSNHINALCEIVKNGGKISLPKKLYGMVQNGMLTVNDGLQNQNCRFSVSIEKIKNVNNLLSNDLIDCDRIIGSPTIRTRREGDSIRLKNRGCTKSINKLFTENKIPPYMRDEIPVISDENGVIWVYGMGVAERVAPTKSSNELLAVKVNIL